MKYDRNLSGGNYIVPCAKAEGRARMLVVDIRFAKAPEKNLRGLQNTLYMLTYAAIL
jgi:hypothetical protein